MRDPKSIDLEHNWYDK
uniref:Uncharacterized protein n=1 Tax=Arundo donax TaxID=35708 RepID=A0A0A8Y463_ARUDO